MKLIGLKIVIPFLLIRPLFVFAGGPWTQPANNGYAQLSFSGILSYDQLFAEDGTGVALNRNVTDITLMGYFEFGLTDRLTLIGYIPYKMVKTDDAINADGDFPTTLAAGSLSGFGNPAVAAKLSLVRGPVFVSGQMRIDGKTVARERYTGLRTGYSGWSFAPSIIVGGGTKQYYAFAEAGVRMRSNGYSNDLVANMEAGYQLFGRLWLAGVGDILQTLSDGSRPLDSSEQTGLYANGQEYFAYGVKAILEISTKWGVNGSIFSAGSGNLVPETAPITVGLYHRW